MYLTFLSYTSSLYKNVSDVIIYENANGYFKGTYMYEKEEQRKRIRVKIYFQILLLHRNQL